MAGTARHSLLLCCLALGLGGCLRSPDALVATTRSHQLKQAMSKRDAVSATEENFRQGHAFKDLRAQNALNRLDSEGFRCSLEYAALPVLAQGSVDRFITENVPVFYCSRPHRTLQRDDACPVLWAVLQINWTDPKRAAEVLKQELASSTVKNDNYFCLDAGSRP